MRHTRWEECTERNAEIGGITKVAQYLTDKGGFLKQELVSVESTADLGDLLRLKNALQRRGLACEVAGLMTFSVHEKIVDEYFKASFARELYILKVKVLNYRKE